MAYDHELADRIREHVGREKNLSEKAMFGGLAFLINGHMAVCASSQGGVMLRVDPAHTEALVQQPVGAANGDARPGDERLVAGRRERLR